MIDPLRINVPDAARELFTRYGRVSEGFSMPVVLDAAANLVVNAIRQQCATRQDAERLLNELYGRSMKVLLEHYDSVTGKRRNIFPHDQHIIVDPVMDEGL